jgi:hypothetical protein
MTLPKNVRRHRRSRHERLHPLADKEASGCLRCSGGLCFLSGCGAATKNSNESTDSSGQVQTSDTSNNLNIKATVTQQDNGRTVKLHVGDGIAVGFDGTSCAGISVDPPGMLVFDAVPTPSNSLFLHAVSPGRGPLVARNSCDIPYTVTIVVS